MFILTPMSSLECTPAPLSADVTPAALQVGFGADVDLVSVGPTAPMFAAFEELGKHVAFYLDNVRPTSHHFAP
jgi:hypothetical protein